MDRGGQTHYYHGNALWSAHALTDSGGNVVERYTYDVYGQVTAVDPGYNPVPLNAWARPTAPSGTRALHRPPIGRGNWPLLLSREVL